MFDCCERSGVPAMLHWSRKSNSVDSTWRPRSGSVSQMVNCTRLQPVESLPNDLGECRRHSPGPDRDWPRVESREDWCGDFERPDVPGSDGV